jgi:hypothetical protein
MYKYTAIIIEPRNHPSFKFVFTNFFENLSEEWSFIIFHGINNLKYIESFLKDLKNTQNRVKLINLNKNNLETNEYNFLLKSINFYNNIPTEVFLLFQTDTLIIKENKNLINDFLEYDYVGAPWVDEIVGNGGLSLRRKSKMIEIINDNNFNNFTNEDEFFCRQKNIILNTPSFEKSKEFSVECVFYESPFGVHNFYNHLSVEECNFLINKYKDLLILKELNTKYPLNIIYELPIHLREFTIIYKTYKNDLEWLKYSLLSLIEFLDKNCIFEIIIYTHDICFYDLHNLLNYIKLKNFIIYRIINIHYDYHGYIKQQTVKANCYKDVKTKYVVMLDSDLLLHKCLNLNELINENGKIVWKYLKREDDPNNRVFTVWDKAVRESTLSPVINHYMSNGFPFIFTTESLKEAANKFFELHNCDYDSFCQNRCGHENIRVEDSVTDIFDKLSKIFSEFEYLGYFCNNFSNDYIFTPTSVCLMDKQHKQLSDSSYFIQNWSYEGLNDETMKIINSILDINKYL